MNEASKCQLRSFAVCSAFRGVFVEYETETGPHVLQIGFRATATQTIDRLVEFVEEGMKKFVQPEWENKTKEIVSEVMRVPSGTRLRVSDSAVVVDVLETCSGQKSASSGGKRVDDSIDLASSWRIKATVPEDDQEETDLEQNWISDLLPARRTSRSQDLSSGLFLKKHRNRVHEQTSSEDPMDGMLNALGA